MTDKQQSSLFSSACSRWFLLRGISGMPTFPGDGNIRCWYSHYFLFNLNETKDERGFVAFIIK